ncbi:hypothetical protein [Sphingomonas parapaucimobilis]|uniref:Nutrient deprivation-induced protein n=1 Tax=Sphingomonas parapaucimobilis NBRC 15100 TaxID=1219049 RepID=A0A0A1W8B4_9SPHN|nr:hypothetical protein [Sphingomonas parapaucimobilis]GAM01695.1 hypothetical protein SP5_068_00630 [Sphingomonas parapaucimobilis NBRC 15100]
MADTDSTFPAADTATPGFGANIAVAPEVAAPNAPLASDTDASKAKAGLADAKHQVKEGATKFQQQAVDKIQALTGDGKAKAGSALDQVAQLLNDAAGQVDEKLGNQYGQYARSAADTVTSLSGAIKDKDVEELLDDARAFVTKSPAVAIGIAAALGFALARIVQSGVETRQSVDASA